MIIFEQSVSRQPHFDDSVLDDLPQHPIFEGCDNLPTEKEIIDATRKLGESGIMAQFGNVY